MASEDASHDSRLTAADIPSAPEAPSALPSPE
jgi:hypothetical protein